MTPNELRTLVQTSISNNTLRLNAAALGDPEFAAIVAAVFGSSVVTIPLSSNPAFTGGIAHIRGRLPFLGLPDGEYEITLNALTPAIQLGLRGTVPPGSFGSVVEALTAGQFTPPEIVQFTTEEAVVSLAVSGRQAILTIESHGGIFDRIAAEARITRGDTDFVILLRVRESDARFSRFIPALAPLDALVPNDLGVLLASGETALANLSLQLPDGIDRLERGALLVGQLPLDGDLLGLVRQLLGVDAIPLRLSLGPIEPPTLEVRSRELPDMDVVPDLLTVSRAVFVVRPIVPIEAAVEGLVRIQPLEPFPLLRGRFAVAPGRVSIEVGTAEPWRGPFGIERLEVRNVTVQGEILPATSIVIAGSIALSTRDANKQMSVVVRFTGGVPSMLAGSFNEPITILDIVETFLGSTNIPDVFSIVQLRDIALSIVPPPLPVTIAGETFDVGFFFKGTVAVAGLSGRCAIRINPVTGLDARAELSRIDLLGLIVVSGPSEAGGPVLVLRDRQSPFLQLAGTVSIFGLTDSIVAEVRADGFDVTIQRSLGVVTADLSCSVGDGSAVVDGSVRAIFSADIGPITVPGTDISMGTIHIADTGFEGQLHAAVADGTVDATIAGRFAVLGMTFNVDFRVDGELRTLEDLPRLLVAELQRNAAQIFAAVLSSVDAWVRFLEQKIVELAEGVARVLVDVFQQTVVAATEVMHRIGRAPDEIVRELSNIGVSPANTALALVRIGLLPVEAATALVESVLGVDLPHIDLGAFPHIDIPTPHFDVEPPHVDIPHIEIPDIDFPHIDIPMIHIDVPPPHIDIPLPHIDIPLPHIDIPPPHIDIGHVDIF